MNSAAANQDSMVFITYTLRPGSEAAGYDDWLREFDNPTFNKTPGIVRYQNWKVADGSGEGLPFTHFDLLQIDGPDSLEQVWFDEPLEKFRAIWVEKWGNYSTVGPAKVNTLAYLSSRIVKSGRPRAANLVFVGGDADPVAPDTGFDTWRLDELVRKHWALGYAKPGEAWRMALSTGHHLGFEHFHLKFIDNASEFDDAQSAISKRAGTVFLGELIASPD